MQMHSDPLDLTEDKHYGKYLQKISPVALFTGQPAADAKGENVSLPVMSASRTCGA